MAARLRTSSLSNVALWILAAVAALFFLRAAKTLLIPIALAVLISYALEPLVGWLERHRVPRLAGAGLVLLFILGAAGYGAYSLTDDARQAIEAMPQAMEKAREMVREQLGSSAQAVQEATKALGTTGEAASSSGTDAGAITGTSGQAAGSLVQRGVGAVFSLAGNLVCKSRAGHRPARLFSTTTPLYRLYPNERCSDNIRRIQSIWPRWAC